MTLRIVVFISRLNVQRNFLSRVYGIIPYAHDRTSDRKLIERFHQNVICYIDFISSRNIYISMMSTSVYTLIQYGPSNSPFVHLPYCTKTIVIDI